MFSVLLITITSTFITLKRNKITQNRLTKRNKVPIIKELISED